MKIALLLISLFFIQTAFAQTLSSPESVEWDEQNNRWLISNKSANEILARDPSGNLSVFVSSVTTPHGLVILGSRVYVCAGSGFLKGYDLSNGFNSLSKGLGASFLNGITTDGDSMLYLTDFGGGDIYSYNVNTEVIKVLLSVGGQPNGIYYAADSNRLIYVSWGANAKIYQINLADTVKTTIVTTPQGNIDGITRDCAGNWYYTAWTANGLYSYPPDFSGTPTTITTALSSAADIDYNWGGDSIGIPNSGNSTLTFIGLNNVINFTDSATIIEGDSILLGGAYQTMAGVFYDTVQGTTTCDSIIETHLSVIEDTTSTSIDLHPFSEAIHIYPNPSDGLLTLDVGHGKASLDIFSTEGRLVSSQSKVTGRILLKFNQAGIYIARVMTIDGVFNKKLIILP